MRSRRRFTFSTLVLVCYTLSLTASGWFHDHHHSPYREACRCCAAHASGHVAAEHGLGHDGCCDATPAVQSTDRESDSVGNGTCPVCQFLSQRTIDDRPVVEIASARLVQRLDVFCPLLVVYGPIACCQIRGPPSVA